MRPPVPRVELTFRPLIPGDAAALRDFYNGLSEASRRTFRPLGPAATLQACHGIIRDNLSGPRRKFDLVAVDQDRIVGWGFLWGLRSKAPAFGLGVADAYHGRRIGSVLMDRVLRAAAAMGLRTITLTVVEDNVLARRMYEHRGFVAQDHFVGEDGLPYVRMARNLAPSRSHAAT